MAELDLTDLERIAEALDDIIDNDVTQVTVHLLTTTLGLRIEADELEQSVTLRVFGDLSPGEYSGLILYVDWYKNKGAKAKFLGLAGIPLQYDEVQKCWTATAAHEVADEYSYGVKVYRLGR